VKLITGNFLELIPRIPAAPRGVALAGKIQRIDGSTVALDIVGTCEGFLFEIFWRETYAVRVVDGYLFEVGRSVSPADWTGRFQAQ